jgi:hypothetical protein
MLLAVLVLLALVGCALLCRCNTPAWPVLLIVLCGLWLLVNKPLEGPVLLVLARGHGITVSDLLAPAGMALAAVLLYRRSTGRRAGEAEKGWNLRRKAGT